MTEFVPLLDTTPSPIKTPVPFPSPQHALDKTAKRKIAWTNAKETKRMKLKGKTAEPGWLTYYT